MKTIFLLFLLLPFSGCINQAETTVLENASLPVSQKYLAVPELDTNPPFEFTVSLSDGQFTGWNGESKLGYILKIEYPNLTINFPMSDCGRIHFLEYDYEGAKTVSEVALLSNVVPFWFLLGAFPPEQIVEGETIGFFGGPIDVLNSHPNGDYISADISRESRGFETNSDAFFKSGYVPLGGTFFAPFLAWFEAVGAPARIPTLFEDCTLNKPQPIQIIDVDHNGPAEDLPLKIGLPEAVAASRMYSLDSPLTHALGETELSSWEYRKTDIVTWILVFVSPDDTHFQHTCQWTLGGQFVGCIEAVIGLGQSVTPATPGTTMLAHKIWSDRLTEVCNYKAWMFGSKQLFEITTCDGVQFEYSSLSQFTRHMEIPLP